MDFFIQKGYHLVQYLPIIKFVHCYRQMSWRRWTAVFIPIIFWYQVHVMKYKTFVLVKLECFSKADVKQHGTVKDSISCLLKKNISDTCGSNLFCILQ